MGACRSSPKNSSNNPTDEDLLAKAHAARLETTEIALSKRKAAQEKRKADRERRKAARESARKSARESNEVALKIDSNVLAYQTEVTNKLSNPFGLH